MTDSEAKSLRPGDPVRMLPQLSGCPALAGPWTPRTERLAARMAREHRRKEPIGLFVAFEKSGPALVVGYPDGNACAIIPLLLERVENLQISEL